MIDANKLANVRRSIIKNNRLEDAVLQQLHNDIKEKAERQHVNNSSNAVNDDKQDSEMQHELIANNPANTEASDHTNTNESAVNTEIKTISAKIMIKLEELTHPELYERIQLPRIRKDRKA